MRPLLIPGPAPETGPLLRLEEITKVYRNGAQRTEALRGVSFEIQAGELTAIMGPSGSGKSTAMNILGLLDRPSGGRYLLNGVDTARLSEDRLAELRNRSLGFVFQSFNLLPRLSALDNVMLPLLYARKSRSFRLERARRLLRLMGLEERASHRPNQLSGGQQQRVAIARALANEPPLILADEPTGNLDSRTTEEILALFQSLNRRGQTVVIVTHEPEVAEYCRRIIRFRDGRVVDDEPHPDAKILPDLLEVAE